MQDRKGGCRCSEPAVLEFSAIETNLIAFGDRRPLGPGRVIDLDAVGEALGASTYLSGRGGSTGWPAPSASRTRVAFSRDTERARSTLATFAHAMPRISANVETISK